ncbi:MAG TPA: hypothetical protein VM513_13980 [Kofleriaceae bacterium]|nr:hypothetical protein [Kofleriaceae bacterium]
MKRIVVSINLRTAFGAAATDGHRSPAGQGPRGTLAGGNPRGTRPAFAVLAIALAACGGGAAPTTATKAALTPDKDAIVKTTENGPVKATIKVWPAKPTLGDAIYARLEIEAPAGVKIDAPYQEAGDQRLGRFRVPEFVRDTQRKPDGGQLHVQTYTLEAPSSGRQRVPPLRLEMTDARDGTAKPTEELLTDEVPIEVAPVPVEKASAPLHAAAGELDPDVNKTSWVVIAGAITGGLALAGAGVFGTRALSRRRRVLMQRSAYDEAVAQLRALEQAGAPDATGADAWFVRLSAIVRHYLEHRYEIRAPELTTEEFLQVATARPELTGDHRGLLTQFLERCDRVKFAGYRPDADESIATLNAARGFVEDTRLREVVG